MYYDITASGKLQIFSYITWYQVKGKDKMGIYKQMGNIKKDLIVISKNMNNIIIADDDRSYISNKNAAYIMGIIFSCKELLNNNKANSLRDALNVVLHHNGKSIINQYNKYRHREYEYFPWLLNPTYELREVILRGGGSTM